MSTTNQGGTKKRNTTTSAASKTTPTTVEGVVTEIIRTFVNSVPHVPAHRKVLLFTCLVEGVGPAEYLHIALGLLLEKQLLQQPTAQHTKEKVGRDCVIFLSRNIVYVVKGRRAYFIPHK